MNWFSFFRAEEIAYIPIRGNGHFSAYTAIRLGIKRCFIMCLLGACGFSVDGTFITVQQDDIKYIYDGDTFFLVCPDCAKGKLGVRVMGVDTPELRGRCPLEKQRARQAKQFAVAKLRQAQNIILVPNPKRRYDRYQRLLANVIIDGEDLGAALIANGLGRPYAGEKRKG